MTPPRFIRPGRTWLVTRRTTRRFFLLRPDADGTVQQIYWYATAVLAKKFGIRLHAVQMLSTHMHEVLTDVHGNLPAFLRERNRALANALKRHHDWPEEVFQRAPASCVEIYGVAALCREIGYTIANCVEAGLVEDPQLWPGVRVLAHEIGQRSVHVSRPDVYFRTETLGWPEHATLTIEMPDPLTKTYAKDARRVLAKAVRRCIDRARETARAAGHTFRQAAKTFTKMAITQRAESLEESGHRNPKFATNGDPELTKLAVEERKDFEKQYWTAYEAAGDPEKRIPFPLGTWRWVQEILRPRDRGPTRSPRGRSSPPPGILEDAISGRPISD